MHKIDGKIKKNINIISGTLNDNYKVSKIFEPNTIDFLSQISKEIFSKKKIYLLKIWQLLLFGLGKKIY